MTTARSIVAAEAGAVLNLSRLVNSWPIADRTSVEVALVDYGRHVVQVEWPAMARGDNVPTSETAVMNLVWQAVAEAGQAATTQPASYAAALEQLEAHDTARRNRLLLAVDTLPATMTITLVVGAVVTVGFTYRFAIDDRWLHGLLTASMAMLVALLLLLQFQLDAPFEGAGAVAPTPMELVLVEIDLGSGTQDASS